MRITGKRNFARLAKAPDLTAGMYVPCRRQANDAKLSKMNFEEVNRALYAESSCVLFNETGFEVKCNDIRLFAAELGADPDSSGVHSYTENNGFSGENDHSSHVCIDRACFYTFNRCIY